MRIIARKTLQDFRIRHPACEQALKSRYAETSQHTFVSSKDITQYYHRASSLPGNRIVFRLKGNEYRLIAKVNYDYQILWIRFIGTHQEYDKINAQII